ncbi:RimK family alpha-L-glutamate ligase [Nonomuraea sp. NPDC050383]|uniref:RimK family alpha-L-glutamate ligase n=1 Tax=Nonomuraea sp. NPDC050383 TaxID=3364362 RepID=UPI00379B5EA3
MTTCAYVTFDDKDGHDDERDIVLAAWREEGIDGRAERWDDPAADWAAYDAVVVRSVWDYVGRRDEFLDWARRVESHSRLLNPASVLAGNTDKTYLRDLGLPVVPTHWSSEGLPEWDEYVVKPAISSGARDTIRTTGRAEAVAHAAWLEASGRTPMVQPYLDMVETEGETSLLYFNRRFSHAVRRTPMLSPGKSGADHVRAQLRAPAPDQVELAEKVLAIIPQALLYARIDLVRLPDGTPVVIELELTEPYLFLRYEPRAPRNLARALRELL